MSKDQFDKTIAKMHIVDVNESIQIVIDKLGYSNIANTVLSRKQLSYSKAKLHLLSAKQELKALIKSINEEQEK